VAPIEALIGLVDHPSALATGQSQTQQRHSHVAIRQIRSSGSEGRVYLDRKVAEGKTKMEALRSLKRQVSNSVLRQFLLDAREGVREDNRERLVAYVTGSTP